MINNRKKKWYIAAGLLLIPAAFLIFRGRGGNRAVAPARIFHAEYGTLQTFVTTTGTVQPRNRLEIKPPVNGRIEKILVREGQRVHRGQILAWMSSTERAALMDAARMDGKGSQKYWEDAYKPIPLIAPIDGMVIVRSVEPGQTIVTTAAVLVLSDRLIIKADVDETDIGRVKIGQRVSISLDAHPEVKENGKVSHISYESKTINNVTMYEVEIIPDRITEFFRSGMSANISIIENFRENVLLVPVGVLVSERQKTFVLVSRGADREPEKRMITTGLVNDQSVEVLSGITEKDPLVMPSAKTLPSSAPSGGGNPFMPKRPGRK